ncbi:unnamed protein product [Wuchereria bancrofti]|uniref:Uncharacterized protein n=1 Tax=Wuchereria bancrofti TaxID=6293 RepID=A0A3P7ES72_WUCBA|nr:unnamed protein product [Wuchereria bancrofti]
MTGIVISKIYYCNHWAVRRTFSRYEFVRQCSFIDESTDIKNKEEHAINLLQNLWDLQNGVKYLEDEMVERHCMEAVQLLVLLWIVHCFEKTEAGQWLQHCPTFYAELFGNNNPRQIIQNLYKTELNNIQMILLTDTLRIRVELLDCSCGDLGAEQPKLPKCLKFPNNKDGSDRSIEGDEGARNHSCRSVILCSYVLGEIITALLC